MTRFPRTDSIQSSTTSPDPDQTYETIDSVLPQESKTSDSSSILPCLQAPSSKSQDSFTRGSEKNPIEQSCYGRSNEETVHFYSSIDNPTTFLRKRTNVLSPEE